MPKIRRFFGCKVGEKLYYAWFKLADELELLLGNLGNTNRRIIRELRAQVRKAWRAWVAHRDDCAECSGYRGGENG